MSYGGEPEAARLRELVEPPPEPDSILEALLVIGDAFDETAHLRVPGGWVAEDMGTGWSRGPTENADL